VDEKPKKDKDLKEVYKREKASKKRLDDPEALKRRQTLRDVEKAIHWKDKRKFLEVLRAAGIIDGSEKFRQLVEIYDQLHSHW
jgi:ribosome-interacting GTPase 1